MPLPDVLPGRGDPPLRLLFCGINPGLASEASGHHYAGPGNRFWPVLHAAGFTPVRLTPDRQRELAALGLGLTNLVPRPTATADQLAADELRAGGERIRRLVARRTPAWLAVLGVTAYRVAAGDRTAQIGPQPLPWGPTKVWVLPNPSGLNARWTMPALTDEFARLREAADG